MTDSTNEDRYLLDGGPRLTDLTDTERAELYAAVAAIESDASDQTGH